MTAAKIQTSREFGYINIILIYFVSHKSYFILHELYGKSFFAGAGIGGLLQSRAGCSPKFSTQSPDIRSILGRIKPGLPIGSHMSRDGGLSPNLTLCNSPC